MANSKQIFLGLVKISGNNWDQYVSAKESGTGKIIFADITTEGHVGKYIYANGVEYAVADSSAFADLEARVKSLEDWRPDVDSSIDRLDSSVSALEVWKAIVDASQANQDASISDHQTRIVNLEEASTALGQRIANVSQNVIDISTYVHTTVNSSIDAIHTKDSEQDTSISDISSRLAGVAITASDNSIGVNGTSVALAGDDYVSLTAAGNTVTASIKDSALVKGTGASSIADVSLATKGYVDDQIAVLEQALVFKGDIESTADASLKLTDAAVQAGYTYVATAAGEYNGKKFEVGDLIIVKEDAAAGTVADIIVVERNLDGAVTASAALDSNYVILGNGAQTIKVSSLAFSDLEVAIANANSALQTVTASTSTGNYVTIEAAKDASNANVSVGVITATLADASNGSVGLAMAQDVYNELSRVEEVTATSITTMADSLGLGDALDPNWSEGSGISNASSYREVIEELHGQVGSNVVNSIGGAHGVISIEGAPANDGSVAFVMDGSTLKGTVKGWVDLTGRVSAAETSIGQVSTRLSETSTRLSEVSTRLSETSTRLSETSTRLNEVSTRLNDLSTYVRQTVDASIDALQAKDVAIDASIDRLDSSVNALETELSTYKVKTIEGEAGISARANDEFVAVSASQPDANGKVTLDASVQLASDVTIPSGQAHETATGLATDGWVKDYLAWDVIE